MDPTASPTGKIDWFEAEDVSSWSFGVVDIRADHALMLTQIKRGYVGDFERQSAAAS